jgi:DNA-binding transcriptional LysR family regulator
MDLRQFRYVVAVADAANFTRAAEAMHVAQPALSSGIKSLEKELGVRLFERTSRRVSLTDPGAAFVAHARQILNDADALSEEMAQYAGSVRGRVRLSMWYHFDPDLPDFLREFIRRFPAVQVSITEIPAPRVFDALRRGDIDIAMPLLSDDADLTDVDYAVVREEQAMLVVAPSSPLASSSAVTLDQICDLPLIYPPSGTSWRGWFDVAFVGTKGPRNVVIESDEVSAVVAYASIGIGVAVMTRRVAEAIDRPIAMVPIEPAPTIVTALAWSRSRYRGPAAQRLLEFAQRGLIADGAP